MADSFPPDAPAPRLCHVVKRADFEGFGFNLYAGKVKQGQFIGKVDANSPAEAAGLKPGDRIIEVNSVNIGNENHKQVKNVRWENENIFPLRSTKFCLPACRMPDDNRSYR